MSRTPAEEAQGRAVFREGLAGQVAAVHSRCPEKLHRTEGFPRQERAGMRKKFLRERTVSDTRQPWGGGGEVCRAESG